MVLVVKMDTFSKRNINQVRAMNVYATRNFFHFEGNLLVFQTKVVGRKEAEKDTFYSVGQMLFRLGMADGVIEGQLPDVLATSLVK